MIPKPDNTDYQWNVDNHLVTVDTLIEKKYFVKHEKTLQTLLCPKRFTQCTSMCN